MTTATTTARTMLGRLRPRRNPWRHPWFLEGFTWLYLIWSLVPVALAVLFSFNNGRSQSVWQGFSWRWYYADPVNSVLHDPNLHAAVVQTIRLSVYVTLITVPLGVAFALGINRWRGLVAATSNFIMILSFVIPELIFGVAMFFVFTKLFTAVGLGTLAEVLALVTWNVSWPALIVQARLVTLGRQYEEAAADLGATPLQVTYRVLWPLLSPAIFASAVLVFSGVIDDFVLVDLLSSRQHPDVGVHLRAVARRQRRSRAERARHDHAGHVVRHRDRRLPRLPLPDPRRTGQRDRRPHHDRRRRLTVPAGFSHYYPERPGLSRTARARAPPWPYPPTEGDAVLEDLQVDDSDMPAIGLVPPGVSWEQVRDHIKIAHHPLLTRPDGGDQYAGAYWTGTDMVVVEDLGPDQDQAIDEFRASLQEHGEV